MSRQWVVDLVSRLPQGLLSGAWGWIARRRRPRLAVKLLQHAFVTLARVDMSEADKQLGDYVTLEDLFARGLRAGVRRIDPEPSTFVCPVDGRAGACGVVTDGTLLQVKGRTYGLGDILDDGEQAARFEGGSYATLYLSPRDYHRVHAPVSGQIAQAAIVPGALMPVFEAAASSVDGLFAQNERLITYIDSPDAGRVAVVKVGAMLVGRISVTYDPDIHTNRSGQPSRRLRYDPPRLVSKGGELGTFEMGSTVVLVAEPGRVDLDDLETGQRVRMGQRIGVLVERSRRKKGVKSKRSPSSEGSAGKSSGTRRKRSGRRGKT